MSQQWWGDAAKHQGAVLRYLKRPGPTLLERVLSRLLICLALVLLLTLPTGRQASPSAERRAAPSALSSQR